MSNQSAILPGGNLSRRLAMGLSAATMASAAHAQGARWPDRPVNMVVGFPPGGQTDFAARMLQAPLSVALGQTVPIDNRAGAGGNIATEQVLRARPDGYTLLAGNVGSFVLNPHTMPSMTFDPMDMTPIGLMLSSPLLLAVHASLPIRTFAEWREWVMRSQPRGIDMGTSSAGGIVHATSEKLRGRLGNPEINLVHYRGSGPALQDFISNRFPTMFDAPSLLHPFIEAGQVRPIMVTSERRNSAFPNVPTAAESGLPNFIVSAWIGLFGPRGLPGDIVTRANAALNEACRDTQARDRIAARGDEIGGGTVEDFASMVRREHTEWGAIVRTANIRAE